MSAIDDGGPAFPNTAKPMTGEIAEWGMTLRDWFAKQGATIHADHLLALGHSPSSYWREIASEGYRFADAMLSARKEES